MVAIWEVEQALHVVARCRDAWRECAIADGDSKLEMAEKKVRQYEIIRENREASALIRRAQMERAWPMLAHLDIYHWPV